MVTQGSSVKAPQSQTCSNVGDMGRSYVVESLSSWLSKTGKCRGTRRPIGVEGCGRVTQVPSGIYGAKEPPNPFYRVYTLEPGKPDPLPGDMVKPGWITCD